MARARAAVRPCPAQIDTCPGTSIVIFAEYSHHYYVPGSSSTSTGSRDCSHCGLANARGTLSSKSQLGSHLSPHTRPAHRIGTPQLPKRINASVSETGLRTHRTHHPRTPRLLLCCGSHEVGSSRQGAVPKPNPQPLVASAAHTRVAPSLPALASIRQVRLTPHP